MQKLLSKGLVATVIASFLWSLQAIFFRSIGTSFGISYPFVIRGLLLSVIFGMYVYTHGIYTPIKKKDYTWFILMPTVGFATFCSIFISLNQISVGTALFLHYSGVLIAGFLFGYVFFKEKLNRAKLIALFLSTTGLFIIFAAPTLTGDIVYLLLAFASGVGSSLWYICSKKLSSHYSYFQILTVDAALLFVFATIFVFAFNEPFYFPEFSLEWMSIIGMTLATLGGSLFVLYGFRLLEAQLASLILLLEVPFGLILAWILFGEIVSLQSLIGGVFILLGVALSNLERSES